MRYTTQEIRQGTFADDVQWDRVEQYNGWTNRETWAVAHRGPVRHNHFTRDVKPRGQCPACDRAPASTDTGEGAFLADIAEDE